MKTILGIDLGTSSVKVMLLDAETGEASVEAEGYDVEIPFSDYAEQDPLLWWDRTVKCLHRLKERHKEAFEQIAAVGLSGQMHGLVALGADGCPVCPAILWLDQRSAAEVEAMNLAITQEERAEILHNRIYPGFAFPSLLWLKIHKPEIYEKISKIMQPKDYIRYRLTGIIGTEPSDASATAAFDVRNRDWAWGLIERFGIRPELFAECGKSSLETAGTVTGACAEESGLKQGIPVIYGCGDQMAQSIGNGIIKEGLVVSNIGTGGQISAYLSEDLYDEKLRTHTFCHGLAGAYTIYGATLSCGLSLKWLADHILELSDFEQCSQLAGEVPPGSDGLIYLPYLTGERTPVMNPHAKGMFYGLKLEHDRRHMIRAVMEGMIFSLKDSLMLLEALGIKSDTVIASGGGASSRLMLQMQADIFEKQIRVCEVKEQACLGACLLAGVGTGIWPDMKTACQKNVRFRKELFEPNHGSRNQYRENYDLYHSIYEGVKALF